MKKFILIMLTVLMLYPCAAYAARTDLAATGNIVINTGECMEVELTGKHEIGSVAISFSSADKAPGSYSVSFSENGVNWNEVVSVKHYEYEAETTHSISAGKTAYIRIDNTSEKTMEISGLKAYESDEKGINAQLAIPVAGERYTFPDTPIKVTFDKEINSAYLNKFTVYDSNDNIINVSATLSGDNRSVILTPDDLLSAGETYTVVLKNFQSWSFKVYDGIIQGAESFMTTGKRHINLGTAEESIDGDPATYAGGDMETRYKTYYDYSTVFTYKLQEAQTTISRLFVSFRSVPLLFAVDYSQNGIDWKQAARTYPCGRQSMTVVTEPFDARYIRIRSIEGWMTIYEFDVYGSENIGGLNCSAALEDGKINLAFSQQMASTEGIRLVDGQSNVSCDITLSLDKRSAVITVPGGLESGKVYTVKIPNTVKTIGGEPFPNSNITVTTPAQTALAITTKSDSFYSEDKVNSIYPAFADGLPYEAWTEGGKTSYYKIKSTGGRAPYTYAVISGSLPEGMTLSQDGKISGTAVNEETAVFTVRVTDAAGNSADKELSMTVNPYRGKWFYDAKFGAMVQWGVFSLPAAGIDLAYQSENVADYTTNIANFEALINGKFSAEAWAQDLESMGVGVLNWTVIAGDTIRMYPSQVSSAKNACLSRDMAGELIEALHRHGIKLVGYISPDGSWASSARDCNPSTGSVARLIIDCAAELAEKGIDGIWLDAGWTGGFVDWDALISTVRTINPSMTVQSNPSVSLYAVTDYPNVDIQMFECSNLDTSDKALHTARLLATDKKMALEQSILLSQSWSPTADGYILKSADAVISNIKSNWDNGATPLLVVNPEPDGSSIVCAEEKQTVKTITDWVKANNTRATKPSSNLDSDAVYSSAQQLTLTADAGDRIYYTLDGSVPTDSSVPYTGSITISESTVVRAAAYRQNSSCKSDELVLNVNISAAGQAVKAASSVNVIEYEAPDKTRLSGMLITVGNRDIRLDSIGRYSDDMTKRHIAIYNENVDKGYVLWDNTEASYVEDGFAWYKVSPVVLKANQKYYVLMEERAGEEYAVTRMGATEGIFIDGGVFSDTTLTRMFGTGAYSEASERHLNLKFRYVGSVISSTNLALGAKAEMYGNSGKMYEPSGVRNAAGNAVDGDPETTALSSGEYAWDLVLDLREQKSIKRIKLYMGENTYATSLQIQSSNDKVSWSTKKSYTSNSLSELEYKSTYAFSARYIRIRALKPNGPDQEGGQMAVYEAEIYSN